MDIGMQYILQEWRRSGLSIEKQTDYIDRKEEEVKHPFYHEIRTGFEK